VKHYTYILKCKDGTLYVGYTIDLERRVKEHNSDKKGAHYTKIRRPVELVYSEVFSTLRDAMRREIEIKSWRRAEKLALIKSGKE